MNASVHLLHRALRSTVHLRVKVPPDHASAPILGTERMGAGTVVEPSGLVLTAHYLVIGASSVEVISAAGASLSGRVRGIDFASGLAAIEIGPDRPRGLPIRPLGADVVGEEAFLVASLDDGRRVSNGVVTSYGPFEAFWEYMLDHAITCSAASPGLGGGPLVDAHGAMLGVVSLSLAEVGRFTLAVPAHLAQGMLTEIGKTGGFRRSDPQPWIGITCYPIGSNVIVAAVLPNSPAEASGLLSGDVVVEANGVEVVDRRSLYSAIGEGPPGTTVRLLVRRGDDLVEISVVAGSIEKFFEGRD